jgi:succinoglycan biosynthesis transport protein ExoP
VDLGFTQADLAKSEGVKSLIEDQLMKMNLEKSMETVNQDREARTPKVPVGKGPWMVMTAAGLGAFFAPFGLALLWELRIKRVSDSKTIQENARLPIIGEIATLPSRRRSGSAHGNPGLWLFEESVDNMRTGITLSEELKDAQVIAVTSASSREGKTSISAQLAVSIARASGHKTLIVDGDMRSPDLHIIFDAEDGKGLADVLTGSCTLDEVIVPTHSPNLDLLPAGHLRTSPHKLVSTSFSNGMLTELRKRYRYVVIDTPPLLSAAESLVMAKAADVSLVCAMRDVSRIDQVERAYGRLLEVDAKPAGIVLNGVPARAYSYSYGKYDYARS